MTAEEAQLSGPDFTQGIEAARLADGAMMLGYANGEAVLLAQTGQQPPVQPAARRFGAEVGVQGGPSQQQCCALSVE